MFEYRAAAPHDTFAAMKRTRPSQAARTRQLRQALFEAQRARGAAVLRISRCNRRVIDALIAGDAAAAMRAKESEYDAYCERDHLSGLIARLQCELDRLGAMPKAPDMRWAKKRMPAMMRMAAASLADPRVSK